MLAFTTGRQNAKRIAIMQSKVGSTTGSSKQMHYKSKFIAALAATAVLGMAGSASAQNDSVRIGTSSTGSVYYTPTP
jgi:hypothetical protein